MQAILWTVLNSASWRRVFVESFAMCNTRENWYYKNLSPYQVLCRKLEANVHRSVYLVAVVYGLEDDVQFEQPRWWWQPKLQYCAKQGRVHVRLTF